MTPERQDLLLQILSNGRYHVDTERGLLYYQRRGEWFQLQGQIIDTGYRQYALYLGRGKGPREMFFGHIVVWIAAKGTFPAGQVIRHLDGNNLNNRIDNLALCTKRQVRIDAMAKYSHTSGRKETPGGVKVIRAREIQEIRELHAMGVSQQGIAGALNLKRLAVRYTINKIKEGKKFKFEQEAISEKNMV